MEQTEKLICPVCQKEFVLSGDPQYTIGAGPTCSWRCFYNYVTEHSSNTEESTKKKGRKKK